MSRFIRTGLLAVALVAAAIAFPALARAALPANDDFANATVIDEASLPFSDSVAIDDATLESGEPSGCYFAGKSIWYSITPSSRGVLRADIGSSSFFDRVLYVYREDNSGFGGLSTIACASPYYNGQSSATFSVEAGKTYYLQVGGFYSSSIGTLSLSLHSIPAPANDDFANATIVGSLPFSDSVDATGAGVESDEPTPSCGYGQSAGTVWYSFTPSVSGSYSASAPWNGFYSQVAAYTGSGLGNLTNLGCRAFGQLLTFQADAGQTYYLQVGGIFGGRGTIILKLDEAPKPVASFGFNPSDPSVFDTVQFYDFSFDPAGVGIQSETWDFGDGGTASNPGCCPRHQYAADGDYTVRLSVTTSDGRTATSAPQAVHVRTHDVVIAKILVPQTASVGQTRQISVGLTNSRYPETVEVRLLKSIAGGGWQQVGVLTQYVPLRPGNRTSNFNFNYTFAPEDATLGKVTFQAVATIQGARDAIQADNTFISLPTKVVR